MTLRPPYNATNINDLKYKISNSKWTLSNKYRAIYSADLCNLLEHILDNNQNTRYNINEILNHRYFASQYNLTPSKITSNMSGGSVNIHTGAPSF